MSDEDNEKIMREISKSLMKSQRHLKSIADCLRVMYATLLVVLFFAYIMLSHGQPSHVDAAPVSVVVSPGTTAHVVTATAAKPPAVAPAATAPATATPAPAPVTATEPAAATTPAMATPPPAPR